VLSKNEKYFFYGSGILVGILLLQKIMQNRTTDVYVNFNDVKMPSRLKPPTKLKEGEVMPRPIKRGLSLNGMSYKRRFDTDILF
jgi:hypothetical protein